MSTSNKKSKKKGFFAYLAARELPPPVRAAVCRRTVQARCADCAAYYYDLPVAITTTSNCCPLDTSEGEQPLLSSSRAPAAPGDHPRSTAETDLCAAAARAKRRAQQWHALFRSSGTLPSPSSNNDVRTEVEEEEKNEEEQRSGGCFVCGQASSVAPLPSPIGLQRFYQERREWRKCATNVAASSLPLSETISSQGDGEPRGGASQSVSDWALSLRLHDAYHRGMDPLEMLEQCLEDSDDDDELPVDIPLVTVHWKEALERFERRKVQPSSSDEEDGSSGEEGDQDEEKSNPRLRYPPLYVVLKIIAAYWKDQRAAGLA